MQNFSESITAEHIEVAIDQILTENGVDMEHTSCTTDKALNMLVGINCKCHVTCACHCLSTCISSAWEASVEQSEE